jgi:hypothetical protein
MKIYIASFMLISMGISVLPVKAESNDLPFCHMITSRGRLIDLTYLCGKGEADSNSTAIYSIREVQQSPLSYSSQRQNKPTQSKDSKCQDGFYLDNSGNCRWVNSPDYTVDLNSGKINQNGAQCYYYWEMAKDGTRCGDRALVKEPK